jgi:hypothetical protein
MKNTTSTEHIAIRTDPPHPRDPAGSTFSAVARESPPLHHGGGNFYLVALARPVIDRTEHSQSWRGVEMQEWSE